MTMPDSEFPPPSSSFRLSVSGSTVYACLKNLLVNEYGMTRSGVVDHIERTLKVSFREFIQEWMNSTETKRMIAQVIQDKVYLLLQTQLSGAIKSEIEKLGRLRVTFE